MSKRNLWRNAEVIFFLDRMKEMKMLGLMDGKRLRVNDFFKSLEKPMHDAGFPRDAIAMQMKFKNLKRDYYKDRRSNQINGRSEFEFFNQMNDLLGDRPITIEKVENGEPPEEESELIDCNFVNSDEIDALEFVSVAGPSSQEISCSETQHARANNSRSASANSLSDDPYQKSLDKFIEIQNEMKEAFLKVAADYSSPERDQILMDTMLNRQEAMLKSCTNTLVSAIKSLNKRKKKRKRRKSSSSSSSSSSCN